MKPSTGIRLTKDETRLLLTIKGAEPIFQKEMIRLDINYEYPLEDERSTLNGNINLIKCFCEAYWLEPEHLELRYITEELLSLFTKMVTGGDTLILKEALTLRYNCEGLYGKYTPTQALFEIVYGKLSTIQINEHIGNDLIRLIDLDESGIKRREIK